MQTKTTLLITGIIVMVVAATMAIRVESVSAAGAAAESAKGFAPGHLVTPGVTSATQFAPGQISGGPGGASQSAPGIEKPGPSPCLSTTTTTC